ncbi:uncharacterized protein LOC126770974 isoform X2 [Nymphalis io]|uniref:uncharacterized protein LOC126770974 isoform X2 n=1 Tax=Inachis io TaxID=171585 RepID=UPI0021670F95|nr:uncharacterized protein LOC126770974 isoform X2 [Nymphalis io]
MLKLPIIKDIKRPKDVCKCRPICKSRRREWKGEVHKTSAELILERKPLQDCFKRWPSMSQNVHAVSNPAKQSERFREVRIKLLSTAFDLKR